MKLNNVQDLISDISQGKMVVIVDDEDRENEGDLILAASKVTPESINFMATHARGLICLALNEERCKRLKLEPMVRDGGRTSHGTAFTVSIEAASGVTTGISASDRATTIKVAVKKDATPDDIVQPGHIFPLRASSGGVLTRAGHTEASLDLAKLAGLEPAAVIVEIMNEDGTMARRDDLEKFSKKHNLKIGTIADLIQYRNINEKTIERESETNIKTSHGNFRLIAYRDVILNQLHLALTKGKISPSKEIMVRVQQSNTLHDVMGVTGFGSRWSFTKAMEKIDSEGGGVLLLLAQQENPEETLTNINFLKGEKGHSSIEIPDYRIVGIGAQILRDLGVKKIKLLGAKVKYPLSGFDLEITEFINYKNET